MYIWFVFLTSSKQVIYPKPKNDNAESIVGVIPEEVRDARFDLRGERAERTEGYVSTRVHEKAKMGILKSEGYIFKIYGC